MKPVEIFHIGPQKSGTTWVYKCLKEHPEIATPPKDSIHYFDMYYSKNRDWYMQHFSDAGSEQKLFDPTPSYIRSPLAPKRIYKENPDAKIILCMRHPIERAFSHYWHEKKKEKYNFEFNEVLSNYDLFSSWIEPGFYAEHIEKYLNFFPHKQILCQKFDYLNENPRGFLKELLDFIGVESNFEPTVLNKKVNAAGIKKGDKNKARIGMLINKISPLNNKQSGFSAKLSGKEEYLQGVPEELYKELLEICIPEIERLEELLNLNLNHWKS
ncbi:MAG: sulfotransferase [Methanolobus sp.]